MAIKTSTGLRNHMMDTGSFKAAMDATEMRIYAGAVPANADADCTTAILLCKIYKDGNSATPLHWEAVAADGTLAKLATEVWSGTVSSGGTAAFFRFVAAADDDTLSTTNKRVQGEIGVVAADLNLSSTALAGGATQLIDSFTMVLPTY